MAKQKILVIVESPKKVDTVKKYLPTDNDYVVLASKGHVADLGKTGPYRMGINIEKDFELSYLTDPAKREKLDAIINTCCFCDKIIIATDGDREGECIGSLIKDRIKTHRKPITRVIFGEITSKGILFGLKNERELDEQIVNAAKARRALDRIVGYMGSPFIIKRFGDNMSAGRVQSVALKLVVEREKQIQEFKPDEYWSIKANLSKFQEDPFVATLIAKDEIKNNVEASAIKAELNKAAFKIVKVVSKPRKRNPKAPLITSKLQITVSNRYKISPAKTMAAAQELYEDGKITYMRTDSTRVSDDAVTMARGWIKNNHPSCLPKQANVYKNKESAQNAHEAIRPTNVNDLPENSPITHPGKVYKVIWEIFVASQMSPTIYDTTTVTIKTDSNKELRANGRILKDPGWLIITSNMEDDDEDKDEDKLPILKVDDVLNLISPKVITEQKFTQPPSRFKKSTLINELEVKGIGRPSTYAAIMEKICETRNFVEEKNDILYPTENGIKVVELLDKNFSFMQYNFTAEMEKKLDLIEKSEYTYLQVMTDFYNPFKSELDKAYASGECETDYSCNKCGSYMILKKGYLGYFLGCSKYPECKTTISCEVKDDKIYPIDKEKEFAPEDIRCPECNDRMVCRKGFYGDYYSCCSYPVCMGKAKIPYGKKCPACNSELFRTLFSKPPIQGAVLCCTGYPVCKYIEILDDPNYETEYEKRKQDIKNNTKKFKTYKIA
ncbi:MAG: type I DNA topoisomerase [Bacteroidia bacterium]